MATLELTDTITLEELSAALAALRFTVATGDAGSYVYDMNTRWYTGTIVGGSFAAHAIVTHARKHREPEYEAGALYLSRLRGRYQRTYSGTWFDIGLRVEVADNIPSRPLRKLVPEQ